MKILKTKRFNLDLIVGKPNTKKNKRGYLNSISLDMVLIWFTLFGKQFSFFITMKEGFKLPNFRKMKKDFKFWFKYYVLMSRVYFEASTTDCDCVTREWDGVCDNIWAYDEMLENIYDNAEGATYVRIIDKKDYKDYHHTTDHIMNAFENGRGRSVNV